MDTLDVVILVAAVAAAVGGYRLGFLGRAASWIGLALGFYMAVRLLPTVESDMHSATPGTVVGVAVALLLGGALVGQALGLIAGARLHHALPLGPVRQADRAVGAGVGALGVLVVLWLLIPSVASVPGWPARAISGSAISRWESRVLPRPPDALEVLRRLISNGAPDVFSELQQGAPAGVPPSASPLGAALSDAVIASTVKVSGEGCGEIFEGSGFTVGPGLVVTNAHVVAGEARGSTSVLLPSGADLPATVIMFDSNRDLALLHVGSLREKALTLASPSVGAVGAVFGHPGGQDPVAISPARVAHEEVAVGPNLYDTHDTRRNILVLAASLARGDSGGALVDSAGKVIGVAFAISPDNAGTAYALNTSELDAALAEARQPSGAPTGSCLNE